MLNTDNKFKENHINTKKIANQINFQKIIHKETQIYNEMMRFLLDFRKQIYILEFLVWIHFFSLNALGLHILIKDIFKNNKLFLN